VSKSELGKFIARTDGIGNRRVGPTVGLEKLNGIGICSIRAAGTLVSVMAVVLTMETEDGIMRDSVKTCDNFASLDENHAVFVRNCQ
jgi:hypothetical protein